MESISLDGERSNKRPRADLAEWVASAAGYQEEEEEEDGADTCT